MCGQHSAVLYNRLSWLLSKYDINIENCSFLRVFAFHFSSIFSGGQLTPFAPMYGRLWFSVFLWIFRRVRMRSEDCAIPRASAVQLQCAVGSDCALKRSLPALSRRASEQHCTATRDVVGRYPWRHDSARTADVTASCVATALRRLSLSSYR